MKHGLGIAGCIIASVSFAQETRWFEDVGARTGIDVVLMNGAKGEKHQIETMPGGVALLDYDGDGRLDIYLVNGAEQPGLKKTAPGFRNRLYRNLGEWKFEDVTGRAGVGGEGYGMGAAAGDYDNDGHTDLFVAGVAGNLLYRNRGNGAFEEVSKKAGLAVSGPYWAIAGAWLDYNRDGKLDLFVARYVKWNPASEPFCGDAVAGYRTYCHPKFYEGLPNVLYRNNGDGAFTDVSKEAGIAGHTGKGMGVAVGDLDQDGWPDLFVCNDTTPNFLFRNEAGARFREVALAAGVAYNDDGRALSSMGVEFRDIDDDGRDDLFVTALINETYPLYRNLGKGLFADVTYPSRIGAATLALSGWGTGAYDFDNDGRKDLFAANGDVQDNTEVFSSRASRQKNAVFANRGDGTFAAQMIGESALHRGAAFGDLDGDGRIDAVVTRLGERPAIYRNVAGEGRHWIGFRLRGGKSNRDGIGARVKLVTGSGRTMYNHATTSVGYASSSDAKVHFGLGEDNAIRSVEVIWPSGTPQRLGRVETDRWVQVREPE